MIAAVHATAAACYASPAAIAFPERTGPPSRPTSIAMTNGYIVVRASDAREAAYHQVKGTWCRIGSWPGPFSTHDLQRAGVPLDVAQRLWLRMERFRTGDL